MKEVWKVKDFPKEWHSLDLSEFALRSHKVLVKGFVGNFEAYDVELKKQEEEAKKKKAAEENKEEEGSTRSSTEDPEPAGSADALAPPPARAGARDPTGGRCDSESRAAGPRHPAGPQPIGSGVRGPA